MVEEAVIVSAVRTPIGKFLGCLSPHGATHLGGLVVKAAIERAGIKPQEVDEVIMGNVISAGLGQNPARQAQLKAGIPPEKGAVTINKVCGSGLKAVMLAAQAVKLGEHHIIVAGGMESMSNTPYLLRTARTGQRMGDAKLVDAMIYDGLWDIYNNFHMGETGELVAQKYGISRQQQDQFALQSHHKAVTATNEGRFKNEILPVQVPQRKGPPVTVDKDEGPRPDTNMEKLAKLPPAFRKDGTVTAGNASQISDGAAAVVVMSARKANQLGIKPLARITGYATGGRPPEWVMLAPIEAVKNLFARTGESIDQFDLIELNEPFAVAVIALIKELEVDASRLNVNGGAVALGHPIGCTGARILTTLIHGLKNRGGKKGLAALCLGGGNAVAMSIEML